MPTRPVQVDRDRSVAGLLEKMEGTGFGGRQLAESHRIWLDMLGDNTTIFVAGSGALIPAGMRRLLAYVIKNRFVDVLVLSGSIIFHDLHETLGRHHFQAHPSMTDVELEASQINRMWDLLASDEEYREADEWVGGFANQLDQTRPYSTREFLHLLGRELAEIATEDGVLTSAYKARVAGLLPVHRQQFDCHRHRRRALREEEQFPVRPDSRCARHDADCRALARHWRHQPRRRNEQEFHTADGSRHQHRQDARARTQVCHHCRDRRAASWRTLQRHGQR
jgi:Deoxyhypusine synthase